MQFDPLYALIMGAAIAAGYFLSRGSQARLGLRPAERATILAGAFCGAMIGAKLPFALSDLPGLVSGASWYGDGKTILTGLVGGYFGVEIAKWVGDIRTKTGDSFAVPVAAAVAIGRLACFRAGCCYGTPTELPWGVVFPEVDLLSRHPTQLYEAGFHAVAAVALYVLGRYGLLRGQRIKWYIIAYAAYRFGTEWLRPEADLAAGLTGYQWASLVLIVLFLYLWTRDAALQRCSLRPKPIH